VDISLIAASFSAVAYGVAPLIYRAALDCTSQYRALSIFALYSVLLGLILPWRDLDGAGVLYAVAAGALGGLVGSWFYVTSVKVGGASVGNLSSSAYIVLLPVVSGKYLYLASAGLVFAGIAISVWGNRGSVRGALFGLAAALAWTWSIGLYAAAVASLGPGGALAVRGATVFLGGAALSLRSRMCRTWRLALGGFVDTFLGFGLYTFAVSVGDYVAVSVVASAYPLITALLERPFLARRALGAAVAFLGVASVFIKPASSLV